MTAGKADVFKTMAGAPGGQEFHGLYDRSRGAAYNAVKGGVPPASDAVSRLNGDVMTIDGGYTRCQPDPDLNGVSARPKLAVTISALWFYPMAMTPLIASSPTTIETYRAQGRAFGQQWRGRSRRKFEESLVKRLDILSEEIAALAVDAEEATAAFDVAAWDAWEAGVTGTSLAGPGAAAIPSRTVRGPKGPDPAP